MEPPWTVAILALFRFAQFKNNSQKINESGHRRAARRRAHGATF
jgi:hypothetical protein